MIRNSHGAPTPLAAVEIAGVPVTPRREEAQIIADIGGETLSLEELRALHPLPDWTGAYEVGPYVFDSRSFADLLSVVTALEPCPPSGNPGV